MTIGNSVTKIGGSAFAHCSGLTGKLNIPDSVTEIGGGAFYECSGLTGKLNIPDSVTSIGSQAFRYCSGFQSASIENGSIGYNAFENCYGLTSVTIGSGVTEIGEQAFQGCQKLIEVWNYSGLSIQKVSSANGYVAYYAKYVYTANEASKQTVTDDGYIFYEDGDEIYLLGYCGTATSLTLPDKTPSGKEYAIYRNAFKYCSGLTSVTIGNGVTSIGDYAFAHCSGLESVTIGNDVKLIGWSAFYECSRLTSATFVNLNGWSIHFNGSFRYTSITSNELGSPSAAAEYLKSHTCDYEWTRKD